MTTGTETRTRSSTAVNRNVCVPPPEQPVTPNPIVINVGQRLQKIERADTAPGLQREGLLVSVIPAQMERVTKADHVVRKDDSSHTGERGAAVLLIRPVATSLGAAGMTMRAEDPRVWSLAAQGTIKVSVNVKAWPGLDSCRLNGIAFVAALFVNDWLKWCSLGQGIEIGADQDLFSDLPGPRNPFVQVVVGRRHAGQLLDRVRLGMIVTSAQSRLGSRLFLVLCVGGLSGCQR